MKFDTRSYGRIYVARRDDIEKVQAIIKELDAFEYEYLPTNFIAHFEEYPKVCYTHKFDALNLDKLQATCWDRGILIWCFKSNGGFPENLIVKEGIIK